LIGASTEGQNEKGEKKGPKIPVEIAISNRIFIKQQKKREQNRRRSTFEGVTGLSQERTI